jgi:hypothetical protein
MVLGNTGILGAAFYGAKRRNETSGAADAHERGKNYLDAHEIERLLEAAKASRHGERHAFLQVPPHRWRSK